MAHPATEKVVQLFAERSVPFRMIEHPPCRTSEESAKARAVQGHTVCGAKAIVVKMNWKGSRSEFNVLVLPGPSKIAAKLLSQHLPDLKDFRFATREELAAHTEGLEPGMMPPFARPIFERLNNLYIDSSLLDHDDVGFNVADLTRSIVVASRDYLDVASPTAVFPFAALSA